MESIKNWMVIGYSKNEGEYPVHGERNIVMKKDLHEKNNVSDFSKYSSRYAYYWSENKLVLLGFILLPVFACFVINIVNDFSVQIIGQKLSSIIPLQILYVIMALSGVVIYNHLLCAIHPEYLFKDQSDF